MEILGLNLLNILPKLGATVSNFLVNFLQTYLTQFIINKLTKRSARNVIIGFFVLAGLTTVIIFGVNTYKNYDFSDKKIEIKKTRRKKLKKRTKT